MYDTLPFFDNLIDYDVDWTSNGNSQPALVDGTMEGRYFLLGSVCFPFIYLTFGPNTNGGTGDWFFSLPFPQADIGSSEQSLTCDAVTNDGLGGIVRWQGRAVIAPPGVGLDQVCAPYFPPNTEQSFVRQARNADNTGAVGTGSPTIPGVYPWTEDRTFGITGGHYIATGT